MLRRGYVIFFQHTHLLKTAITGVPSFIMSLGWLLTRDSFSSITVRHFPLIRLSCLTSSSIEILTHFIQPPPSNFTTTTVNIKKKEVYKDCDGYFIFRYCSSVISSSVPSISTHCLLSSNRGS